MKSNVTQNGNISRYRKAIQEEIDEMTALTMKLNQIEEKAHCGSIRFLDWLADSLELLAKKVRLLSVKLPAACVVKFK